MIRIWQGTVTFGCAITIPESELDEAQELAVPAFAALALANDLFSYAKEREDAAKAGLPHVVNAVWIIMNEHGCDEREAKEICRERIRREVARCVKVARETRGRDDLSDDTKRYIELLQYSVSGNILWSTQCPRYHKEVEFNESQSHRAMYGRENDLSTTRSSTRPTGHTTTDTQESSRLAHGVSPKTPLAPSMLQEDGKHVYWGINGVGVCTGNGVDENGVGHLVR